MHVMKRIVIPGTWQMNLGVDVSEEHLDKPSQHAPDAMT